MQEDVYVSSDESIGWERKTPYLNELPTEKTAGFYYA
jgi:hypothetical protein